MYAGGNVGIVPIVADLLVEQGTSFLKSAVTGGNPRAGGTDPCCPPGYNPVGTWPRNSNVDGAPPDYRTKGSPMTDASPSGVGRLKDDVCDCVPIKVRGRLFVIGEVRNGSVYTGPPSNRDQAMWVEVDSAGRPIRVPGVGVIGSSSSPTEGTTTSSGGSSSGGAPVTSSGGGTPLTELSPSTSKGIGWAVAIPVGLFLLRKVL